MMTEDTHLQTLIETIKHLGVGRKSLKFAWWLHLALRKRGWTVRLIHPEHVGNGVYLRPQGAALTVSWPLSMAIEIAKTKPGKRDLDRLRYTGGRKVLVLIWSRGYKPWEDKRGQFRHIEMDELDGITMLAAGGKEPVIQTRESLALDYARYKTEKAQKEEAEKLAKEQEIARVTNLILDTVRIRWQQKLPASCDPRVIEPERHLPTHLHTQHQADPDLVKRITKDLEDQGVLIRATHRYTTLSGLNIAPTEHLQTVGY